MQFNVFPFKTECTQVVCGVTFANTSVPGVPQSFLLFYECETLAALMGWAGHALEPSGCERAPALCAEREACGDCVPVKGGIWGRMGIFPAFCGAVV